MIAALKEKGQQNSSRVSFCIGNDKIICIFLYNSCEHNTTIKVARSREVKLFSALLLPNPVSTWLHRTNSTSCLGSLKIYSLPAQIKQSRLCCCKYAGSYSRARQWRLLQAFISSQFKARMRPSYGVIVLHSFASLRHCRCRRRRPHLSPGRHCGPVKEFAIGKF